MPANTISFTNLHASPEGWFLTARSADGKMATYDLSRIHADAQGLVTRAIVNAIRDPAATRTDLEAGGIH